MYPPRYAQPSYNMQYQGRPVRSKWPMQHRNRPTNYHLNGSNNFQTQTGSEEYWCETCDRGFPSLHILENHKKQHQKCNIDGCQFVAHPKVITKHIQMQHSTGLFNKIANLNKPEEIKKWREERKSRYPTRENIEKKAAAVKEKLDRGEKMAMRHHNEQKYYKTECGTKRKFNNQYNNRQNFKRKFLTKKCATQSKYQNTTADLIKKACIPQRDSKLILPVNDKRTLKPFTGILHLLDENNDNVTEELPNSYNIEDDEYIVEESNQNCKSTTSEPIVCGALSSLMCSYGSSDEESTPEIEQKKHKPGNLVQQNNKNNTQASSVNISNDLIKSDDESGPEEVKIVKGPSTDNESESSKSNSKDQRQVNSHSQKKVEKTGHNNVHKRNNTAIFKPKLPSTLLEKLLCNEIRQERNIVLQCIRHIIKSNYFEKNC